MASRDSDDAETPERHLQRVKELAAKVAHAPELDARTLEEILGYDEDGLPR
jgi:hypothetical protein